VCVFSKIVSQFISELLVCVICSIEIIFFFAHFNLNLSLPLLSQLLSVFLPITPTYLSYELYFCKRYLNSLRTLGSLECSLLSLIVARPAACASNLNTLEDYLLLSIFVSFSLVANLCIYEYAYCPPCLTTVVYSMSSWVNVIEFKLFVLLFLFLSASYKNKVNIKNANRMMAAIGWYIILCCCYCFALSFSDGL
jgi:hypothetical protein